MKALEWSQGFPRYNPIGAICCHGNQSSDPIWPKTLCSQSPTPMMQQMKFYYDWPAGLRDTHVWKCGQTDAHTDGRWLEFHTISSPWAFGSGVLKMDNIRNTIYAFIQWFIYNFGFMGPGSRCFPYKWVQLQTYESRTLFLMTSLQYYCILGLVEIITLHPRDKIMRKRCRMRM